MSNQTLNEIIEYFNVQDWLWSLTNFMAFIMLFVHLFSCLWMMGSVFNFPDDINKLDFENTRSWLIEKGLVYKKDDEVLQEDNFKLYLACSYWAFTTLTTIGYGDIAPYSLIEKIICLLWILFGVALFSYVIGSITSMLENQINNDKYLAKKLNRVETFTTELNSSQNFRQKVRRSIE